MIEVWEVRLFASVMKFSIFFRFSCAVSDGVRLAVIRMILFWMAFRSIIFRFRMLRSRRLSILRTLVVRFFRYLLFSFFRVEVWFSIILWVVALVVMCLFLIRVMIFCFSFLFSSSIICFLKMVFFFLSNVLLVFVLIVFSWVDVLVRSFRKRLIFWLIWSVEIFFRLMIISFFFRSRVLSKAIFGDVKMFEIIILFYLWLIFKRIREIIRVSLLV